LHDTHDYGFFARDASNMGYWLGHEILASLLPVVKHMKKTIVLMLNIYLSFTVVVRTYIWLIYDKRYFNL